MSAFDVGVAILGLVAMVSFVGWLCSAARRRLDGEEIDGLHSCLDQSHKAINQLITERDSQRSLAESLKAELLAAKDQAGKLKPLLERESKDRARYSYLLKLTDPRCKICGRMLKRGFPWVETQSGPAFVCGNCIEKITA